MNPAAIFSKGGDAMNDVECLLNVIISTLRRYHPHGPLCESSARHPSDLATLELCHEKTVHICLDLAGSGRIIPFFWVQLEKALRPIREKKIAWDELPKSVDDLCRMPVRGVLVPDSAWPDLMAAEEARQDMKHKPPFDGKGVAKRLESPHTFRYERRGVDSE